MESPSVGRAVGRVPAAGGVVVGVGVRPLRRYLFEDGGREVVRHHRRQERGGHHDNEHRRERDDREPPHEREFSVLDRPGRDLEQIVTDPHHPENEEKCCRRFFKSSHHDLGPPEASHVLTTSFVYRERLHL